jgi:hypothetical protein
VYGNCGGDILNGNHFDLRCFKFPWYTIFYCENDTYKAQFNDDRQSMVTVVAVIPTGNNLDLRCIGKMFTNF